MSLYGDTCLIFDCISQNVKSSCFILYPLMLRKNLIFIDVGLTHHNSIGALNKCLEMKAAPGRDVVTTLISTRAGETGAALRGTPQGRCSANAAFH